MSADLDSVTHRRFNPLEGRWILVSPHRSKRPWQGQQESASTPSLESYDASCYLCPGNRRAQGQINPDYADFFLFDNDFSAIQEQHEAESCDSVDSLLRAEPVRGRCLVLTFTSKHNQTLANLSVQHVCRLVKAWTDIYSHFLPDGAFLKTTPRLDPTLDIPDGAQPREVYRYMQIFENKGAAMGCSNAHPHGQAWMTSSLPTEIDLELRSQIQYRHQHNGAHMLDDYAQLEARRGERLVYENADFLVLCPWWATWPFEVMILARRHMRALVEMDERQRLHLAQAIAETVCRYDNLFQTSFPYSMGIHQAPLRGTTEELDSSWLHIHFYPPLLRSATVRKFLVGYEMLAEAQRDITPEQAAARLRACGGPVI